MTDRFDIDDAEEARTAAGRIAYIKPTGSDEAHRLGLIPANLAEPVRSTYREFRRMQHVLRLNAGRRARVERASVSRRIEAVRALWEAVFGVA